MTIRGSKIFIFVYILLMPILALGNSKVYVEKFLPRNYVRNATVDYTTIIQNCVKVYDHVVLPNFPILINDNGIKLKNNSTLEFQGRSKLILKASNREAYDMIAIHSISNVKVLNPQISGDKNIHRGKQGEHGMGISIKSSSNVEILNGLIENCWGDGIYVGRLKIYDNKGFFKPSTNIAINNVVLNGNRRNAISVTSGINIEINGVVASNTLGTAPMAGIDIEPNSNKDYIDNIKLNNVITKNNRYGIQIVLKKMLSENAQKVNIAIDSHTDYNSQIGLRFDQFNRPGKGLIGRISISNCRWIDNKKEPLAFNGSQEKSAPIFIEKSESKVRNSVKKMNSLSKSNINNANVFFK